MKQYTFFGILFFLLTFSASAQVLLDENFDYPEGDSLGAHGWVTFNGTTNVLTVVTPGLTYSGYVNSGIGNAARVRNNGYDAYKQFTNADTSGSVFCSFMVTIDSAQTGDYFFALLPDNSTTNYTCRVHVKDTLGGIKFGLSKSTNPIVYTSGTYSYNTTYLLVAKYTFISGTQNDEVRLFVLTGAIPGTEPAPTIGPVTQLIGDAPNISRIALRQGSVSSSPTLNIDGFRVCKSWSNITAIFPISKVAEKFSLQQNYPNPFNPMTTIEFSIPENSYISLDVYDILGRKVTSAINENLESGSYKYIFDGSELSSGIYYYALTAIARDGNTYTSTKSMVLIK